MSKNENRTHGTRTQEHKLPAASTKENFSTKFIPGIITIFFFLLLLEVSVTVSEPESAVCSAADSFSNPAILATSFCSTSGDNTTSPDVFNSATEILNQKILSPLEFQQLLKDCGFYSGKVDGRFGDQTMIAWQQALDVQRRSDLRARMSKQTGKTIHQILNEN